MRISENTTYLNFLRDLQLAEQSFAKSQATVSSGKRVLRPSDDPAAAADILRLTSQDAEATQFGRNLSMATSKLEAADGILSGVEEMIARIRNLGLMAVSDIPRADHYLEEVRGLREQVLAAANSSHQGSYLFSGSLAKTQPFVKAPDSSVSYAGNSNVVAYQVNRTMTLQAQVPGSDVFSGAIDVFAVINDLADAIDNGDFAGINTQVRNLEDFTEILSTTRSLLGSTINVASSLETERAAAGLSRAKQRDDIESANMAQAISELTRSQTSLQSTLATGARLSQLTLLDYLR